jgi:hypothetical protein
LHLKKLFLDEVTSDKLLLMISNFFCQNSRSNFFIFLQKFSIHIPFSNCVCPPMTMTLCSASECVSNDLRKNVFYTLWKLVIPFVYYILNSITLKLYIIFTSFFFSCTVLNILLPCQEKQYWTKYVSWWHTTLRFFFLITNKSRAILTT